MTDGIAPAEEVAQQVANNDVGEDAQPVEAPEDAVPSFTIYVVLSDRRKVALPCQPSDTVQEIRMLLAELRETCHLTSYHLEFNATEVPNHALLSEVEGLQNESELVIVEDAYTERSARIHISRFRDLAGLTTGAAAQGALHANVTLCAATLRVNPETVPFPATTDRPGLEELFAPADLSARAPTAVTSVTLSAWNAPPPARRLAGDLMYLDVVTLSGTRLGVTASVNGFHVNGMTSDSSSFMPLARESNPMRSTTLAGLLTMADEGFAAALEGVLSAASQRTPIEHMLPPYTHTLWAAPAPVHTRNSTRAESLVRAADGVTLGLSIDAEAPGQLRDWNDEYQGFRALATETLEDRTLRLRALAAVHADFVKAATTIAAAIVDGNVPTLTPGESPMGRLFLHSNILFSFGGVAGSELVNELGGVRAVRVSVSKDIAAGALVDAVDVEGLGTIRTAAIDYRGFHVIAQSLIPGILKRSKEDLVDHGSVDHGKTVRVNEKFNELLATAGRALSLASHTVTDEAGVEHTLSTSVDVKGILATDGRRYVVDLYRMTPVDVNFAEGGKAVTDLFSETPYDHPLTLLRIEFVSAFYEHKAYQWLRSHVGEIEARKKEAAKAAGEPDDKPIELVAEDLEGVPPFSLSINPDCFTEAKVVDADGAQQQVVRDMAEHMWTTTIPTLAQDLVGYGVSPLDSAALRAALHSRGINMRYLGRLASLLPEGHTTRQLLVSEMIARSAKHLFRTLLAETPLTAQAEGTAHFFSTLLGDAPEEPVVAPAVVPAAEQKKEAQKKAAATAAANAAASTASKKQSNGGKKHKQSNGGQQKKSAPKTVAPGRVSAPLVPSSPSSLASLTREALWSFIESDVRASFRYEVSMKTWSSVAGFPRRTAVLRSLCQAVGVQVAAKNYVWSLAAPVTVGDINGFFPVAEQVGPNIDEAREMVDAGRKAALQGQLDQAAGLLSDALMLYQTVHGPLHEDVASTMSMLATLYHSSGNRELALQHQERSLLIAERVLGTDDPEVLRNLCNLAYMHHSANNTRLALSLMRHAENIRAVTRGDAGAHPQQAYADTNVGLMLQDVNEPTRAGPYLTGALDANRAIFGVESISAASSAHLVARVLAEQGNFREALEVERTAFLLFKEKLGLEDPRTREADTLLNIFTQRAVMSERGKRLQEVIKATAGQFAPQLSEASSSSRSGTAAARKRAAAGKR